MDDLAQNFAKPMTSPKAGAESAVLGRLGSLTTRFADGEAEIEAALRLRYDVFVEELGASAKSGDTARTERDAYDARCKHLLVLDEDKIVGTYRIYCAYAGQADTAFYSQSEFDLAPLLAFYRGRKIMELGRSCIASTHRSRRTMELLWHGAWATAVQEEADAMFGCASLAGVDISPHLAALSWLAAHAVLPPDQQCPPRHLGTDFRAFDAQVSARTFAALPALLKGYLRLGAKVSPFAVPDPAFNTTDVLVVLDVATINPRYLAHYGKQATRFAE